MNKGQVFFNCDYKGKIPISVAVYSLLSTANPQRPLCIHLVHDDGFANDGGCEKIREIVGQFPFATVIFANISSLLEKHPELLGAKWPPITWAWAFCTEIFPGLTGNLVFIDWDMYVRKDLGGLYDLDLEGQGMVSAAVNESLREHRPLLVAAGWPRAAGYSVNSGTQVINTDAFRREHIREKMFAWYVAHKDIAECVEQDAANAVYGERILRLHLKYNFTVGWFDRMLNHNPLLRRWRVYPTQMVFEACADPSILHFIGHRKPWWWNHRAYRNVYRKAMEKLGLFDPEAYGETLFRKAQGVFFDLYNAAVAAYARFALRTIFRKCRPMSDSTAERE